NYHPTLLRTVPREPTLSLQPHSMSRTLPSKGTWCVVMTSSRTTAGSTYQTDGSLTPLRSRGVATSTALVHVPVCLRRRALDGPERRRRYAVLGCGFVRRRGLYDLLLIARSGPEIDVERHWMRELRRYAAGDQVVALSIGAQHVMRVVDDVVVTGEHGDLRHTEKVRDRRSGRAAVIHRGLPVDADF